MTYVVFQEWSRQKILAAAAAPLSDAEIKQMVSDKVNEKPLPKKTTIYFVDFKAKKLIGNPLVTES
jgi:hypothetical protein